MVRIIFRALRWKAKVVVEDEYDSIGMREALNFGHTSAHALEGATRYSVYRHGEAVLIGMQVAIRLSEARKMISSDRANEILTLLAEVPVPKPPRTVSAEKLWKYTLLDKKVEGGCSRFILIRDIGRPVIVHDVSREEFVQAFQKVRVSLWGGA